MILPRRGFLRAVIAGTALGFLVSICRPLIGSATLRLQPYLVRLPPHALAQVLLVALMLFLMALFARLPRKIWVSAKFGLIPLPECIWVLFTAAFWVAYDAHDVFLALSCIPIAALLTMASGQVARSSRQIAPQGASLVESDLPVPEGGRDLLGRREIIDGLVSMILLEQPTVVAVTGAYGDGKTSLLNLTVGEIRKLQGADLPVIVRFSPWLARDSSSLVLSLLDSVVAEIKGRFFVPGLGRDATHYARAVVGVVPKTARFRDFIGEPSQEQRITALGDRISRTRRRVLVVLDDLDRMQADELETVFKLLRGSDRLSNITFLCSFDKDEVVRILRAARPHQDTSKFIEKFFQVQVALPKLDSGQRKELFSQKLSDLILRCGLMSDNFPKSLDEIWEGGADLYFENLRRIKLFLNRIGHSLERIASEVNAEDFIRLELIRDVLPSLYEHIYRNPEFFCSDLAIETSFRSSISLDRNEAKKQRSEFYGKMKSSVPDDKQYVLRLLESLFPDYARYREIFGAEAVQAAEAERGRRIFHPRCFRQYFQLKVPSELFSQKDLDAFVSSIRKLDEGAVADTFTRKFQALAGEEFKQWHFMHLLENIFDEFKPEIARGLCRGMARGSARWSVGAFDLLISVRATQVALVATADSAASLDFLRTIFQESASAFYSLELLRRLEDGLKPDQLELAAGVGSRAIGLAPATSAKNAELRSQLEEVKGDIRRWLRELYLVPEAPSVFEQFGGLGPGRIEPNIFLLQWRALGVGAEADQQEYLRNLFARRPEELGKFLNLLFRAPFIDDYSALKPLIDYKELSDLITQNERILDPERVRQFKARYSAEPSGAGS